MDKKEAKMQLAHILQSYYGTPAQKVFRDIPIMEGCTVVDNLTEEGNESYGKMTNMLYDIVDLFETMGYGDEAECLDRLVDALDNLANDITPINIDDWDAN